MVLSKISLLQHLLRSSSRFCDAFTIFIASFFPKWMISPKHFARLTTHHIRAWCMEIDVQWYIKVAAPGAWHLGGNVHCESIYRLVLLYQLEPNCGKVSSLKLLMQYTASDRCSAGIFRAVQKWSEHDGEKQCYMPPAFKAADGHVKGSHECVVWRSNSRWKTIVQVHSKLSKTLCMTRALRSHDNTARCLQPTYCLFGSSLVVVILAVTDCRLVQLQIWLTVTKNRPGPGHQPQGTL